MREWDSRTITLYILIDVAYQRNLIALGLISFFEADSFLLKSNKNES